MRANKLSLSKYPVLILIFLFIGSLFISMSPLAPKEAHANGDTWLTGWGPDHCHGNDKYRDAQRCTLVEFPTCTGVHTHHWLQVSCSTTCTSLQKEYPQCDGFNLMWVKAYGSSSSNLCRWQKSLIESNSSQCGYCSNECSSGAKMCSGNTSYTCGNYDSDPCTEWGNAKGCGSTNNYCNFDFDADGDRWRTNRGCSGGSCFASSEKVQDCGSDSNFCSGGDAWKTDRGCSGSTCFSNNTKVQTCGTNSNYCGGDGDVWQTNEGCSGGACYNNTDTKVQDCGSTNYYCNFDFDADGDRWRTNRGCSGSSCFASSEKVQDCGNDSKFCSGGDAWKTDRGCSGSTCFSNDSKTQDCGTNSNYCGGDGNVWQTNEGCSSNACFNNADTQIQTCGTNSSYCSGTDLCWTNAGCSGSACYDNSDTCSFDPSCVVCVPNDGNACTSSPNACGQTNSGTIQCDGSCSASTPSNPAGYGNSCQSCNDFGDCNSGTIQCDGSCSATAPLGVRLTASPSSDFSPLETTLLADISGSSGTINYTFWWDCNDPGTSVSSVTAACGDPTNSAVGAKFDGVLNDPKSLLHSYISSPGTLIAKVIAERGSASPAEDRIDITILPPLNTPPTASNLTLTQGDYCTVPSQRFSWDFSDTEDGTAQTAYQLQIDNNSDFSSPEVDSTKVASPSTERFVAVSISPGSNQLAFSTTYNWRIQVYDSADASSGWVNGTAFSTPFHPYPDPDFTWSPPSPSQEGIIIFTDTTTFFTGVANQEWAWSIPDATYVDATTSSSQNPHVEFTALGIKTVILSAIDTEVGGICSITRSVTVGSPLPEFEEVAP